MIRFIASGFGCGYAKVAPGTFGSAGGLALGALLLWRAPALLPLAGLLATLLGLWAVHRIGGDDDPGWITIDEVAGQLLALLPLSTPSPLGLLAAFALFRLLDILKPGPATPVTLMDRSASERATAPSAMARATGSLTAPWAAMRSGGTPTRSVLASFE